MTKPPRSVRTRLADVPRHYKALGYALEQFESEEAYVAAATSTDPSELARAYAVERPFELLENYVIELAHLGLIEAGAIAAAESTTGREDLRSLAASRVITKTLRDRLVELHELRNQLVHEYPDVKAHRLYAAATALLPLVRDFIARYLAWLADLGFETSRGRLPSARRRRRPRRAAGRSTRGPGRPLHATGRLGR